MPQTYDLILKNGRVFTPGGLAETSIGVRDGKIAAIGAAGDAGEVIDCGGRSEEHTSELQSLMRTSYAVFCLKKKNPSHPPPGPHPLTHCTPPHTLPNAAAQPQHQN